MVYSDRAIYQDQHVRIIIVRPENNLQLEAGYIYADCHFEPTHLLQSRGGPYNFVNNQG